MVRGSVNPRAWLLGFSFEAGPPEFSFYAGPLSLDVLLRQTRRGDRAWQWCWTLVELPRFSFDLATQYWVIGAAWGMREIDLFLGPLNLTFRSRSAPWGERHRP